MATGMATGMMGDIQRPEIAVVVLLASAGGLDALSIVLRDLPTEFSAAVLVQQHLGGLSSVLPTILGRQTPLPVNWARNGQAVVPGQVIVGPPGMRLELTRDGRCHLHETEALGERRFDVLLASVARSYGARSMAVMLSGSGKDGADGTVAMKRAGAIVIAQSPDTAQYSSMPIAAAEAGADLVLPIDEIGQVLAAIVAGAPLPKPRVGERSSAAIPSAAISLKALAPSPRESSPAASGSTDSTDSTDSTERYGENAPAAGGESMTARDLTHALHGHISRLSPDSVPNSAAARAEMARVRAAELRRRRQDLSAGFGCTEQTVAVAQRRAADSLRRAQLAHQAAESTAAHFGH
jgi:hypothetical protein